MVKDSEERRLETVAKRLLATAPIGRATGSMDAATSAAEREKGIPASGPKRIWAAKNFSWSAQTKKFAGLLAVGAKPLNNREIPRG